MWYAAISTYKNLSKDGQLVLLLKTLTVGTLTSDLNYGALEDDAWSGKSHLSHIVPTAGSMCVAYLGNGWHQTMERLQPVKAETLGPGINFNVTFTFTT